MKPALENRQVLVSGALSSSAFGISTENQVHVLTILRDTLYTNKVLAVLREYSANAWDANRETGRGEQPIEVVLPTELEASLIIRDNGPGLSERDVFTIYTQYGASTKRSSNLAVGMLGIGSKSAFAYNDSFTITSWHGGTKSVYHAVLDESNIGKVMKIYEGSLAEHLSEYTGKPVPHEGEGWVDLYDLFESVGPMEADPFFMDWVESLPSDGEEELVVSELEDEFRMFSYNMRVVAYRAWLLENYPDTETGIQIKVPVNPSDVPAFHQEAQQLFRYFRPLPKINTHLSPPEATWKTENGFLSKKSYRHSDDWIAVMGCVPYRLNLHQVISELEAAGITNAVESLHGGLYFEIGDVNIVANREELEYKQRTKDAIVAKFSALLDDVTKEVDTIVGDTSKTPFARRLEVRDFMMRTQIPLSEKYEEWRSIGAGVQLYTRKYQTNEAGEYILDGDGNKKSDGPQTFVVKRPVQGGGRSRKSHLEEETTIPLSSNVRLLIKDTLQPWKGYVESGNDRVVTILKGHTVGEVEGELKVYMAKANLTGLEVLRMTDMRYLQPVERLDSGPNQKHAESCFQLTGFDTGTRSMSQNWTIAQRQADEDDVYVIINRFVPVNVKDRELHENAFFNTAQKDAQILEQLFKEKLPTIWGLKTTAKKPVKSEETEGIEYGTWRKQTFQECLDRHPEVAAQLEAYEWANLTYGKIGGDNRYYEENLQALTEPDLLAWLKENLDGRHRIVQFFSKRAKAQEVVKDLNLKLAKDKAARYRGGYYNNSSFLYEKALQDLAALVPASGEGSRRLQTISDFYPLLGISSISNVSGLAILRSSQREEWLRYINLIDNTRKN